MAHHAFMPNCVTTGSAAHASGSPGCCTWRGCKAAIAAKDHAQPPQSRMVPAPDLVKRDFVAPAPDRLSCRGTSGMSRRGGIPLSGGRRSTPIVVAGVPFGQDRLGDGGAFTQRVSDRSGSKWRSGSDDRNGVIHHSDQGSQYTSLALWEATARGGHYGVDGEPGRLLRQCDGGELFCHPRMRTARPTLLSDSQRRSSCGVRLHRRLLQHPSRTASALALSPPCHETRWARRPRSVSICDLPPGELATNLHETRAAGRTAQ